MKNRVVSAAHLAHRGALCPDVTHCELCAESVLGSLSGDVLPDGSHVWSLGCHVCHVKAQIRALSQRDLGGRSW